MPSFVLLASVDMVGHGTTQTNRIGPFQQVRKIYIIFGTNVLVGSDTSITFVKLSVQYILLLIQSTAIPISNSCNIA